MHQNLRKLLPLKYYKYNITFSCIKHFFINKLSKHIIHLHLVIQI